MSDLTIVVAKAVCKAAGYDPVGFNADTLPENESHDGWQNWMGFQDEARAAIKGYLSAAKAGDRAAFQARVQPWMMACFGAEISADGVERNHRFLEEALELVQALGCTQNEAHQLVDYVYGRDVGDPKQEVGGVMVTLAALCLAHGLDMHACGETELARIWTKVEAIRVKQAAKPKHSPLPMHVPGKAGERADGANLQDLFAGWKLVPVEPTEAMKKQAAPFFSSWCELECSAEDAAENVWDEMISAAPKAPIAEGWIDAVGVGMVIAAGIVEYALGETTAAKEILGAAGVTTIDEAKKIGVDDYDIGLLKNVFEELAPAPPTTGEQK